MAERQEAEIRIDRADLRSFFLYTLWLKKRLMLPVLIFTAGVGLLLILQGGRLWPGIALLALVLGYAAWRMSAWAAFRDSIPVQGLRYRLALSERDLVLENLEQGGGSKYRLEKFAEVRETGAYLFLYSGPLTAVILPKRELPDELALKLRQRLRERLGSRYGRI